MYVATSIVTPVSRDALQYHHMKARLYVGCNSGPKGMVPM